jgi:myo-inositol 2-dehydrogenase/D-chiro-inositol 1-dehydrogenase
MNTEGKCSRRNFLNRAGGVVSGSFLAGWTAPRVHAGGFSRLRLGLIGCGGRGTGAAANALAPESSKDVVLWAMADLFTEHLEASLKSLASKFPTQVEVPPDRRFTGFEGYRGVIDTCDVVLVCTPPRFTAKITLEAVRAKRHVFFEITGAVDVPTVNMILEADALSRQNSASLLDGHVYRAHLARREAIQRLQDGQIGEILAIHCDYMRGWYRPLHRRPEWSELEYQIRNWNWFNWLNGGHVGNTLSHNLDSALWALGDKLLPEAAYGMGGRSTHLHPSRGTSYDHEAVVYEFPEGLMLYGFIRNADGCFNSNRDIFHGSKGRCYFRAFSPPEITDLRGKVIWRAEKELAQRSAYEQELIELLESVRKGQPIHRGKILANVAMMCVLGQLAVFTGQRITWEEAVASNFAFPPEGEITWETPPPVIPGDDGLYPVPIPGVTTVRSPMAQGQWPRTKTSLPWTAKTSEVGWG